MLCASLWFASMWWVAGWQLSNGDSFGIGAGYVWASHFEPGAAANLRFRVGAYVIVRPAEHAPVLWLPAFESTIPGELLFRLPLWIPAILLGALWWWVRGARIRPDHCEHCGYSLEGLTGVCPECGGTNNTDGYDEDG